MENSKIVIAGGVAVVVITIAVITIILINRKYSSSSSSGNTSGSNGSNGSGSNNTSGSSGSGSSGSNGSNTSSSTPTNLASYFPVSGSTYGIVNIGVNMALTDTNPQPQYDINPYVYNTNYSSDNKQQWIFEFVASDPSGFTDRARYAIKNKAVGYYFAPSDASNWASTIIANAIWEVRDTGSNGTNGRIFALNNITNQKSLSSQSSGYGVSLASYNWSLDNKQQWEIAPV